MNKVVTIPHCEAMGSSKPHVEFATLRPGHYVNLIVGHGEYPETVNVTLSPEGAKNIAAAINEMYPAPTPAKRKTPKGAQAYKGNGKHCWELVAECDETNTITERLRVPGGWVYRDRTSEETGAGVFVPVPNVVGYVV